MTIKRTDEEKLSAAQEGWDYANEWVKPLAEETEANRGVKPEEQSSKVLNAYVGGKKFQPGDKNPLAPYYRSGIQSRNRHLTKPDSIDGLKAYLRSRGQSG